MKEAKNKNSKTLRSFVRFCEEPDGNPFGTKGRCGSCEATEVRDWIDEHIDLLKM